MATDFLDKVYKKDPETICRIVDEEPVIIPLRSDIDVADLGAFYILENKTAACIWDLIDGKRSVGQIIKVLLKRFRVQERKAEADTVCFIKELDAIKAIAS